MQSLNRGSNEGALKAYLAILKQEPKDRRIRQKVGELYLKLGKTKDAEVQFREVTDALIKEGAFRAAVALLKQLVTLRQDDVKLQIDLADCYVNSGYPNDARQHFDAAMRLYQTQGKPREAAAVARRLSDLSPGEPVLRLKMGELLEAAGDGDQAATVYLEVIEEYRRRGRPDEVGRVAELALKLRPDDLGILIDAAAARLEAKDDKKALAHLNAAYALAPRDLKVLELLSRAFEGLGQLDRALPVLHELSRLAESRGDLPVEADALRRAAMLSPDDVELRQRLAGVEERVSRLERRLTSLILGQPANEGELRASVRCEVYARYGMLERAETAIRQGLEVDQNSLCLLAALSELLVQFDRKEVALRLMERIVPRAEAEGDAVRERMAVLKGERLKHEEDQLEEIDDPISATTADTVGSAVDDEARGDRLADAGDIAGAITSYRAAMAADPLNEEVMGKIAALRTRLRAVAPPIDEPPTEGTFAEVSPDELAGANLDEARSLVAVGMFTEALPHVEGHPSLEAKVIQAMALKGMGDAGRALDILREATNEAADTDPGYADALFELSGLYTTGGKARSAMRLLEELQSIEPEYRRGEVEARVRGLQRLIK